MNHLTQNFKNKFEVAIADSNVEKNTKAAVEMVRQKCDKNEDDRKRIH